MKRPTPGRALLFLGLLALAAAGCHQVRPAAAPRLALTVLPPSPAHLEPGAIVQVTARPEPPTALAWVSGTVRVLGAPVAAFVPERNGAWVFRMQVPPFVVVPAGTYAVRAWGRSRDGREVRGELNFEVR